MSEMTASLLPREIAPAQGAPIDGRWFRKVMGHYPTGVCVVTSVGDGDEILAMVVGSFTSVSLDPPLVAFLPGRSSTTWPRIQSSGRFCVNVLAYDQVELCRKIAAKAQNRLEGIALRCSDAGMPVLSGVVAWVDCALHSVTEAGDHDIALGRVEELQIESGKKPLIFLKGGYAEARLPPSP